MADACAIHPLAEGMVVATAGLTLRSNHFTDSAVVGEVTSGSSVCCFELRAEDKSTWALIGFAGEGALGGWARVAEEAASPVKKTTTNSGTPKKKVQNKLKVKSQKPKTPKTKAPKTPKGKNASEASRGIASRLTDTLIRVARTLSPGNSRSPSPNPPKPEMGVSPSKLTSVSVKATPSKKASGSTGDPTAASTAVKTTTMAPKPIATPKAAAAATPKAAAAATPSSSNAARASTPASRMARGPSTARKSEPQPRTARGSAISSRRLASSVTKQPPPLAPPTARGGGNSGGTAGVSKGKHVIKGAVKKKMEERRTAEAVAGFETGMAAAGEEVDELRNRLALLEAELAARGMQEPASAEAMQLLAEAKGHSRGGAPAVLGATANAKAGQDGGRARGGSVAAAHMSDGHADVHAEWMCSSPRVSAEGDPFESRGGGTGSPPSRASAELHGHDQHPSEEEDDGGMPASPFPDEEVGVRKASSSRALAAFLRLHG